MTKILFTLGHGRLRKISRLSSVLRPQTLYEPSTYYPRHLGSKDGHSIFIQNVELYLRNHEAPKPKANTNIIISAVRTSFNFVCLVSHAQLEMRHDQNSRLATSKFQTRVVVRSSTIETASYKIQVQEIARFDLSSLTGQFKHISSPWWLRQHAPLKRRWIFSKEHSCTSQKILSFKHILSCLGV
jgi:hypothetical protein